MAGCIDCGAPTPNRRCRSCSRAKRWEDRFDEEEIGGGHDEDDQDPATDGGVDVPSVGEGATVTVEWESPHSTAVQDATGAVSAVGEVEKEYAPTGTRKLVVDPRGEDRDLVVWPAWGEVRSISYATSADGIERSIGDLVGFEVTEVATDGGEDLTAYVEDQARNAAVDDETPTVDADDEAAYECAACGAVIQPGERFVRVTAVVSDGVPDQYATFDTEHLDAFCTDCGAPALDLLVDADGDLVTDGGTTTCPACGHESEEVYKCDRCGKPFEGDEDDDGDRRPWGVTD